MRNKSHLRIKAAPFKFRLLIGLMLVVMGFGQGVAQEGNLTQYQQAPLYVNPALAGTESALQAIVHHRSQELIQRIKLNSSALTVLVPLMDKNHSRRWGGWGLSAVHQALTDDRSYVKQGVSGAYAYNLPLYKRHFLSFGMNLGYFQRKLSLEGYTTGNQWNSSTGFNPDASLGESIEGTTSGYLTGGAGFVYYMEDDAGRKVFSAGGSAFNLNQPDISFSQNEESAAINYTGHLAVSLVRNEKVRLGPDFLYSRSNNLDSYYLGASASFLISDKDPFDVLKDGMLDLKAGYRVNNALTWTLTFWQPNFFVGFSYDMAVAEGNTSGTYGNAFEVTLGLRKLIKPRGSKPAAKASGQYSSLGQVRKFYFTKKQDNGQVAGSNDPAQTENQKDASGITQLHKFGEGTFEFKLKQDFKFGLNDAELNKEAKKYLDELAEVLRSNSEILLEVVGHTDNTGNSGTNKRISTMRALAVVDYLVSQGISRDRLKVTAMGDTEPLAPNDSEENRALNRRVEFVIYSDK